MYRIDRNKNKFDSLKTISSSQKKPSLPQAESTKASGPVIESYDQLTDFNSGNIYQSDKMYGSALISILTSLFYSKRLAKEIWKNYDSNIIIYLQEYLTELFVNLTAHKISHSDICYMIEILHGCQVPLKVNKNNIILQNKTLNQTGINHCNSDITKELFLTMTKLFELSCNVVDIHIKSNVSDTSRYYAFLTCEERNTLDLFNEWNKNNKMHEVNDSKTGMAHVSYNYLVHNLQYPDYLMLCIKKDKNTKINIQKILINKINRTGIKYYFRAVICYCVAKCNYYCVIKILSNYYLFDLTDTEQQLKKIQITKMTDAIKTECINVIYKK
jgi:hypothetical protein